MRGKSVSCLGQYTAERLLLAMNTSLRFAVLTGFRLGKTPRIIYQELVQAHGEAICPAERTVERWVCEMKKGTFPLVKNKPPGRPRAVRTTDLVQDVSKMLQDNPRSSLREVALQLGTDHMTIFRIVTCDLDLKSVCSVWVPAVLSEANKKDRIKCAKTILKNVSLSVQHKYCVEDELWVNWGVIGTKMQNRAWLPKGARRMTVPKPKLTPKKTMLLVAFTTNPARFSITALQKGQTIDSEYMVQFFKDTNKRFSSLRRNKIKFSELLLQIDNARPHTSKRTQSYLETTGVELLKQSPYSPDLNLCDRFLFTRLQEHCRATLYLSSGEVYEDVQRYLRQLPETYLVHELGKLCEHCKQVILAKGDYVVPTVK